MSDGSTIERARRRDARPWAAGMAAFGIWMWGGTARADRVADAHRRLGDIEQRAHMLTSSFHESYAPDPNAADRRVVEAENMFALKNYNAAATLCLDVIEKYPNSRAYDDALVLLGDALFKDGDFLSARRYLEQAAKKTINAKKDQLVLQRLVEISLRTGDYSNVEEYLERLGHIPQAQLEPSVPYVRGKYLFFRDRLDEALTSFQFIAPGQPYYLQSRYFIATIQTKKGDFAAAARSFDEVLKVQPADDGEKEIQDLARLAIGRLLYDRGQLDRAKEWYSSLSRQSKYFAEAMYESAWNSIKAKDYKAAYRSLDLMLLQDPDSAQAPELRLLIGNLHLRLNNFYLASSQFTDTLEEYEPLYKDLNLRLNEAKNDPKYYDRLVGESLDKFDITSIVPKGAAKLISAEPDVSKMMVVVDDVGTLERGIKESEQLVERLQRAVDGANRIGIFPDLASARTRSTEMLNQTIDLRRRFQSDARGLASNYLSAQDRAALEEIAGERGILDQELKNLPLTEDSMKARAQDVKGQFASVDVQASEVNVAIQQLQAEVVAIEQYYIHSRAEQKIRPEDIERPVAVLKSEIAQARDALDNVRNQIADASQEAAMAGLAGAGELSTTVRLAELLKKEQEILSRARAGMNPEVRLQFDGYMSILERADGIQTALLDFDGRLDGIADKRLTNVKEQIAAEKGNLEAAGGQLHTVVGEGQSVGGSLAGAMLTKATGRFYDLTVQSDVGLIDVSWGIKDAKTQNVSKLVNQQRLERQAVEDDFQPLLREEDK